MLRWIAPAVLAVVLAIVGYGLADTLRKNVMVAPQAAEAASGRLHPHLKNATRFTGDAAAVREAVGRAVFLHEGRADADGDGTGWQQAVRGLIAPAEQPRHVVVLPGGDDALAWALPGAYWAVYAGSPVVFVGHEALGSDVAIQLRRLDLPAYVLAPQALIAETVVDELRAIVPATRVAADDLAAHAVAVAEFRDPPTNFGWGRSGAEADGYFHYVLAAPSEAEAALAALPLAWSNAATLLYAGDDGGLPAATDRYLWAQRSDWFVTPSEGPFRHLWLVGNRISYGAQARADLALEKAPYTSRGPAALGGMEALAIAYIALGLASALFVLVHGLRLLPEVMATTRAGWVGCALLLPVLGMILYLAAFRRPVLNPGETMPRWLRPPAVQAAAATAVAFGYGAPIMIAIGWLFAWFGFPLAFGGWSDLAGGWAFLLGAGMPVMMIGMYVGAILVAWLAVQAPMRRIMGTGGSLGALGVTIVSMTAVSLGMMTTAWLMMMNKLPMMPEEDELLWFGAMWLASGIGFLIAWPLNWPMVRLQLKPGAM